LKALIDRFNNLDNHQSPEKETLRYVLTALSDDAQYIIDLRKPPNNLTQPTDQEKYSLAQAFNELIESPDFYNAISFKQA